MNEKASSQANAGRSRWRWLKRIALAAVAIVVVAVLVMSVWTYVESRALNRVVDNLRAAGEPVTFDELAKRTPPVPPEQDGGPYYGAAMELASLVGDPAGQQELLEKAARGEARDEALREARALTEAHALTLSLVDQGSARPSASYDLGTSHGIGVALPKISRVRTVAKLVSVRTRLLALEGQADQAVQSLVSQVRLTRVLNDPPMLIVHLTQVATLAMAVTDAQYVMSVSEPSEAALKALREALAQAEMTIDMKRVWQAERVYVLEMARNLLTGGRPVDASQAGEPHPQAMARAGGPFVRRMVRALLESEGRMIEAAEQPWPQMLETVRAIDAATQSGSWANMLTPKGHGVVLLTARAVGQLRAAGLATRIEQFRRTHSRLPQSLEDLPTAADGPLPEDPFTGQPLMYRPTAQGYDVVARETPSGAERGEPREHGVEVRWAAPTSVE